MSTGSGRRSRVGRPGPLPYSCWGQDTGGSGPVVVLLHGLAMAGTLWRHVVGELADEYRCVVPTLPLGGHRRPMCADADPSPRGIARLQAEFLDALDAPAAGLPDGDQRLDRVARDGWLTGLAAPCPPRPAGAPPRRRARRLARPAAPRPSRPRTPTATRPAAAFPRLPARRRPRWPPQPSGVRRPRPGRGGP